MLPTHLIRKLLLFVIIAALISGVTLALSANPQAVSATNAVSAPGAMSAPSIAQSVPLPNITVDTTAITDDQLDGHCDLYEALMAVFHANYGMDPTYHECQPAKVGGMNVIAFSVAGGTITLPTDSAHYPTDLPMVYGNTVILGPIAIAGNPAPADTHLLKTAPGATLTVIGVVLKNGYTTGGGSALYSDNYATINVIGSFLIDNVADDDGGAIYSNGDLNLMGTSFIGNQTGNTPGRGGAVYMTGSGSFKSEASTFTNNTANLGGAVYLQKSGGEASVNDSIFTGNAVSGDTGGAICNASSGGTLTIQRTAFNVNLATQGKGGAFFNGASATTIISDTLFNGNIAGTASQPGFGGAISNDGELSIAKSTFLANSMPADHGDGGAVMNSQSTGHLSIANSTFNGNSSHGGGGALYLLVNSSTVIRNSTFAANTAAIGDAIYAYAGSNVTIGNTIIDQGNCFSAGITSLGNNIDSDGTCGLNAASDLHVDPLLGSLALNGGALPVLTTQKPSYSSPAIDAGSSAICANPAVGNEDETGAKRPQDANHTGTSLCDIGAVEVAARTPAFNAAPLPPGPINLGLVEVGKVLTASFTISDTGNYQLTVSNPTLGDAVRFGVSTTFPIDVGVNQQKQIVLACKPTANGAINTTFVFSTTDADRPNASYVLNCAGASAAAPAFASIPPASMPIEFGEVAVGTVVTQYLTIKNNGTANLNLNGPTLIDASGSFTHNLASSLDIAVGASHAIAVACRPTQVGTLSSQLLFHTNDGSQSPVTYHLNCNGVPPESAYLVNLSNLKPGILGGLPSDMTALEAVATSPDGMNAYVTGNSTAGGQVVVLHKDTSGFYSWASLDSRNYLKAPYGIAVSPDGKGVLVTGYPSSTLASYQRDGGTGALTQLGSYQNGSGISNMSHPMGVAYSPDSQFVYVAATGSDDIVILKQNPTPGFFNTVGVVTSTTMTAHTLVSPQSLVVSPDGKNVYVTAYTSTPATDGTLAVYQRDTVTGLLTPIQTFYSGECLGSPYCVILNMAGPWHVTISPDGSDVYVTCDRNDALIGFHRDPVTGLLTAWNGLYNGFGGVTGLNGARGVVVSPDGKHVFATADGSQALTLFDRNPLNGHLTLHDVYTRNSSTGIPALNSVREVAVSSDGQYVFAVSTAPDNAVVIFRVANPVPALYSLLPASVAQNSADFTLVVKGAGFVDGAFVVGDGYYPTTTYLNSSELHAAIPAALLASAGTHTIKVHNPSPGGGDSFNTLTFQVLAPAATPVPSIDHLSPASVLAGTANVQVDVYGANFAAAGLSVTTNGSGVAIYYIDSTHVRIMSFNANTFAQPGTINIQANNNGVQSNIVALIVTAPGQNPVPSITSLSPAGLFSLGAGSPQFTLVVNGTNFVDGASVQWNGDDRPTKFINSTQVQATIYGSDQLWPAYSSVAVQNPAPGGGTSNIATFIVRPLFKLFLPLIVR